MQSLDNPRDTFRPLLLLLLLPFVFYMRNEHSLSQAISISDQ